MKPKILPFLIVLVGAFLLVPALTFAQGRSEFAVSTGAGTLVASSGGGITPVFSLSYRFHITDRFSAEGALDTFTYKYRVGPIGQQYDYRDGYLGAEAALVWHLRSNRGTNRWIPFVDAGIGRTTTDFTEIPAATFFRAGIGASYFFKEKYGIRVELRDEIVSRLYDSESRNVNIPNLRVGLVYRF